MLEKVVTLSRRYCEVILQMKKRAVIVLLYTTLLTGCSITSPETVFESHEGQFLTYNSFSTEYISGLNTSDYNPENFYPIPEGVLPFEALTTYLSYAETNDFAGYNRWVFNTYYDSSNSSVISDFGEWHLTSDFSEEYVQSCVNNYYDENKLYPVPEFLPEALMSKEKERYQRNIERGEWGTFNWLIWYTYYNDSVADVFLQYPTYLDVINYNVQLELEGKSHSLIDYDVYSEPLDYSDRTPYWREQQLEQEERAKIDAGIIDFNILMN